MSSFIEELHAKKKQASQEQKAGIRKDLDKLMSESTQWTNMPKSAVIEQQTMMENQAMNLYNLGGPGLSTNPRDLYSDKNAHTVYKRDKHY
jgi:hypothetical protein